MHHTLEILLIEDNQGDARLIEEIFRDAKPLLERIGGRSTPSDVRIQHAQRLDDGLAHLRNGEVDVILLDLGLPDSSGIDTLNAVVDITSFVPIVVLTGQRDEQLGVEAIQEGAQDYLVKDDVTSNRLVRAIHHAIERNRQEREQALQQRRLKVLNVLTRELMEAETTDEVCRCVVASADDGLDLPVMAIALYDHRAAALEPAVMTATARNTIDIERLLKSGTGVAWQAFSANTIRRVVPDQETASDFSELTIFPLSNHGILVVGATTTDGLGEPDFELSEIIAGNLESAFDRVTREQELFEREQRLDDQNQRLERLNQVNSIIRNIAQGLVEASTQEEVEQVVCHHLAADGPYDVAWVGTYDVVADRIVPSEWVGGGQDSLRGYTADGDYSADVGDLATQTMRTRLAQVENNLAANPPFTSWQQAAIEQGYQSSIAVPLMYQDIMFGVLTLYATEPDAFDHLVEAVLEELGTTIGYALHTLEQRKAFASERSVELEFEVTAGRPPLYRLAAASSCRITFAGVVRRGDDVLSIFIRIKGRSADDVVAFGKRVEDITQLRLIRDRPNESTFEVQLPATAFCAVLFDRGASIQSIAVDNGKGTIVVRVPDGTNVRALLDLFETQYDSVELTGRRELDEPIALEKSFDEEYRNRLTERQAEILQMAFVSGFFESPRETTALELAELLDVSQPTVSGHIREGERKLFELLFNGIAPEG